MKRSMLAFVLAAALAPMAARADTVVDERIVPADRLAQEVEVRDVRARDGTVTGTIVNHSDKRLRDVRLMIRHNWLWNDEVHPGTDTYSRTEYLTIPDEIPPGGRGEFTYRPSAPLVEGRGGRFDTDVRVASVVEVTGGSTAPTAGAGRAPREEPLEPER